METVKVIVDRKRWLRGEKNSKLLRKEDSKMCCLGFACLALGCTEENIIDYITPWMLNNNSLVQNKFGYFYSEQSDDITLKSITYTLMAINDNLEALDREREQRLIDVGNKIGLEFEFIN